MRPGCFSKVTHALIRRVGYLQDENEFVMARLLLETRGFDRKAQCADSIDASGAVAPLVAAAALCLSLLVAIATLSFEILHTTSTVLLL